MTLRRTPFAGDVASLLSLADAAVPDHLHRIDLPYRLASWALDDTDNVALWTDDRGELAAWALLQTPFWTIDYALDPASDTPALRAQILSWADDRARATRGGPFGHPCWFVAVRESASAGRAAAEAAGFVCQADVPENPWSQMLLRRPVAPAPECTPPEGVTIRSLHGEPDVDAYVALHRAVFGSENMTRAWRLRTLERPELDLVAVDDAGRLAGFCIAWFSEIGLDGRPAGQIEPLGVRHDLRRRGVGRALLSEAIRRLRARGAEAIYVETDEDRDAARGVYGSVGFEVAESVLIYRKDYHQ